MQDTRVYIVDKHDHEIEVYTDVTDSDGDMVGVYLEGPNIGVEIKLEGYMIQQVNNAMANGETY